MFNSKELVRFLNTTERNVKKLDATDILLVVLSGLSLGVIATVISRRVMKVLAPFIAILGMLSSSFIITKLFFSDEEDVPYIKVRKE